MGNTGRNERETGSVSNQLHIYCITEKSKCMKSTRCARACRVIVEEHLTHREKRQICEAHTQLKSCLLLPHALLQPRYTHKGVAGSLNQKVLICQKRWQSFLSVMKSELVFLLVRLICFGGKKCKAMRKCSAVDSQGWRGEDPEARKTNSIKD